MHEIVAHLARYAIKMYCKLLWLHSKVSLLAQKVETKCTGMLGSVCAYRWSLWSATEGHWLACKIASMRSIVESMWMHYHDAGPLAQLSTSTPSCTRSLLSLSPCTDYQKTISGQCAHEQELYRLITGKQLCHEQNLQKQSALLVWMGSSPGLWSRQEKMAWGRIQLKCR